MAGEPGSAGAAGESGAFSEFDEGEVPEEIPRERLAERPGAERRGRGARRAGEGSGVLAEREGVPHDPNDRTIYVGRKNVMAYVLAVVTQFEEGAVDVTLKARGRSISRAVDVTQIVKNRFIQSLVVRDVEFGTEELPNREGGLSKVSSMTVALTK